MAQRDNTLYNLITIFFIGLSVIACLISLLIIGGAVDAGPFEPATDVPIPTVQTEIPSLTPSLTPPPSGTPVATNTPADTATWTPFPSATPSNTFVPTGTFTPTRTRTFTPSPTFTGSPPPTETETPSITPTETLTPEPSFTPTFTPTPSPTGPTATPTFTPAPFALTVGEGTPLFRDAYLHPGCQWQGFAGQIRGLDSGPLIGYIVQVTTEAGTKLTQVSGTNTNYGPSGWEIQVGSNGQITGRYRVQVFTADGATAVSPEVSISFSANCQQNLTLLNFVQVAPLPQ
ncbi:MAG: hypothetical protein HY862_10225 [Chloroflexi bacterium]|nr:hypothetical protein [Chloroflexota bacterium]